MARYNYYTDYCYCSNGRCSEGSKVEYRSCSPLVSKLAVTKVVLRLDICASKNVCDLVKEVAIIDTFKHANF